jgi:HSP20 family molecular chaperone IbpA
MSWAAVKTVVTTPNKEAAFRQRSDRLKERIRRRAFELYCRRTRPGTEKEDWLQAERETLLSHLAGIEDNGTDIKVTAAVPDVDPSHLTVDILPDSLVVEGDSAMDGSMERCSAFPLHCVINPATVRAELRSGDLVIKASKMEANRSSARSTS